jgi:hypothetical protein
MQCRTQNCEAVYVEVTGKDAKIIFLGENIVHGNFTISWYNEDDVKFRQKVERNFIGRIVDSIRRRKPDYIYISAEPRRIRVLRSELGEAEVFSLKDVKNPVEEIQEHMDIGSLDTIDEKPLNKIGGSHSTVIGGRKGQDTLRKVASSQFVKKVIPGPIDGGGNSRDGFGCKVGRANRTGNLKVILKEGGTVQTIRVVTTASNRSEAEHVEADIQNKL